MPTVLLEIGTEELPAGFMPPVLAQLADLARVQLQSGRIAFEELHCWGTPRRIVLYLTGVAEYQAPAIHEVRGPAVPAAFASNGEPTQAAIGFARSQGLPVNDLRIRQIDGAEYVVAIFHEEGRPIFEVLPEVFTSLITGLTFPKTMRWGTSQFRFARPIRWVVALLDESVIPLTVDGVTSGRLTRGHRFLAPGEVEIASAGDYPRMMDENQVIVDQRIRRELIWQQLEAAAGGAHILDDGALLDETSFRVEFPTAVRGAFDPSFLILPPAVLLLVLKREQNFFPLADDEGTLLPAFLAVRNGDKAYLGTVREGYEDVARAKLLDALFFFEQDRRQPLAARVDDLHNVVFQERLGSLYEKTKRIETLAGLIAAWLEFPPEERNFAERAALLAKADLVTAMVVEHPELQGTLGGIYARLSGEPDPVATAIGEQYQPRAAGDAVPASALGRVLALADKLDTVVADFSIGLIPTGSEDPLGLRREAQGVARILIEGDYRLSLSQLIERALRLLPGETLQPRETIQQSLSTFFRQRLDTVLAAAGCTPQVIKVALSAAADIPAEAAEMARFLQQHLADPTFLTVARLAGRLMNITKDFAGGGLDAELLTEPAELALLERYQAAFPEANRLGTEGNYQDLLDVLAPLAPAIDHFFGEILVMAEDPALRLARLSLIWHLANLFRPLGDLSLLGL